MKELVKEIKGYMEKTKEGGEAWGQSLIRSEIWVWDLDCDEKHWNMTEEMIKEEFDNIVNQAKEVITINDYPVGEKFWKDLTELILDYDYCKVIGIPVPGNSCEEHLMELMNSEDEKELLNLFIRQWKEVEK